jgi:glucuronosyltransferase
MSFKNRLHNLVLSWADYIVWNVCYLYQQDQIIQEFFPKQRNKKIPSVYDLDKNVSAIFVNSHKAINIEPNMPNIFYINGIHMKKPQKIPTDIKTFLDEATNGVIYVNLGSEIPPKLMNIFLQDFAKRPQRILLRSNDESTKSPQNFMIRKWMSQKEVLFHKNVVLFITHGSILSLQDGMFSGLPMLVLPKTVDQV